MPTTLPDSIWCSFIITNTMFDRGDKIGIGHLSDGVYVVVVDADDYSRRFKIIRK